MPVPIPLTRFQLHVNKWRDCQECELGCTRTKIVFARGSVPCDIVLVGEAPGESENVIGKPFVGPAGKLLDSIIEQAMPERRVGPKIISGGQTGVDQAALHAAKSARLETGGYAPLGWKTLDGPNLKLGSIYGLIEAPTESYAERTEMNVWESNATLQLYENPNSPGEICTLKAVDKHHRPLLRVDLRKPVEPRRLASWLREFQVVNIVGNSETTCPGITSTASTLLSEVFALLPSRRPKVAMTNLVCCIPREEDGSKTAEPPDEAIEACSARLREFVEICDPKLIVAVGALARDYLTPGYKHSITFHKDIPVIDIIHPAAILRMNIAQRGLAIRKATITLVSAVEKFYAPTTD